MEWTLGFMGAWSDWIVGTPYSRFLQGLHGLVPITQTIHILSISILFSSAVIIDLRLLGMVRKARTLRATIARFSPALWTALGALVLTGVLLLSVEPGRSLLTYQFQVKMILLALAISITLFIQRAVSRQDGRWEQPAAIPFVIRTLALLSMLLWMGIIFAGRWIAYA